MNSDFVPGKTGGRQAPAASAHATGTPFESVALLLQGGGALGAYQAGVYEALREIGVEPSWIAGISIGAINSAIIAGNAPDHRVEKLRAFWELVSEGGGGVWPSFWGGFLSDGPIRGWLNQVSAGQIMAAGAPGFFKPRLPPPYLQPPGTSGATSWYDTAPLRATLERLVDFDRINAREARFSVGAVNVRTGNFAYFDNYGPNKVTIRPEHVMASGALPPAFAAVEIDGEYYWDGGIVSNTPLDHVLGDSPRRDSLVFQVDLWRAQGILPRNLMEVAERQKDIQYSSRTRYSTKVIKDWQDMRTTLSALLKEIPPDHVTARMRRELEPWLSDRVYNVIHLIYESKPFEEQYKDYAFAPSTMREHWRAGLDDMQQTLAHREFFVPPSRRVGAVTHDVHKTQRR